MSKSFGLPFGEDIDNATQEPTIRGEETDSEVAAASEEDDMDVVGIRREEFEDIYAF